MCITFVYLYIITLLRLNSIIVIIIITLRSTSSKFIVSILFSLFVIFYDQLILKI